MVLWCNYIAEKKHKQNLVLVFLCFSLKKNTKTHRFSGAVLLLKKGITKLGHCVFVFFVKKKNTKTQKHIGSLVQFFCCKNTHKFDNLCFS